MATPTAAGGFSTQTDNLFTIQTDTVLDDTSTEESLPTTTDSDEDDLAASSTQPYTGTCATAMMTGNRPYWAKSGYDPFECGTRAILRDWTTYCCNGNLIDLTQPLRGDQDDVGFTFINELCFENMRCCSGDPALTVGAATTCTAGTEASLLLESSVSSEYYAAVGSTTSEYDPSETVSFGSASTTSTSMPNAALHLTPWPPILSTLLLIATILRQSS